MTLTYSIITPARNEADTLPHLWDALRRQTFRPVRWVIVENGSVDSTAEIAADIAARTSWATTISLPESGPRERGAPIVRSFMAGLAALGTKTDVVVNVDADVTMNADYFEHLLAAFEANTSLGIASGSAWEWDGNAWRQRFVTRGTVWGATRAYRWECLQAVLPLEARHGWDGVDQLKARARGWHCETRVDLPFRHNRPEGSQDASRWHHWRLNGETAYFMGYRPTYLALRTMYQLRREPEALGLLWGYMRSRLRRAERMRDAEARAVLREDQQLRNLLHRREEAAGKHPRTRFN